MPFLKFFLALLFTLGLTMILNTPNPLGAPSVPALGGLLNPFTGFWANADHGLPRGDATYSLPGLQGPVQVVYDKRLVPHVFASTQEDAFFMQGYLTAQHRLWQLDITVRGTAGRLSEILGPDLLERDKMQRRKGLLAAAEQAVAGWQEKPEQLGLLSAYVDGINAYIDALKPKDYPLEYKLLGYKPERWSMLHTAVVLKAMSNTLCSWETDVEATNTLKLVGQEAFRSLFPEYNPAQTPIIPAGSSWPYEPMPLPSADSADAPSLGFLPGVPYERPSPFLGSNNWVVSGEKTASGYPILCNDPHLNLTLPAIWLEMQVHTPDFNTYGVHLPGLPGILIGFNDHIAWGLTNGSQDVLDWYQIEWLDPEKTTYRLDGQPRKVDWRVESYQVKGKGTVLDSVKWTHWGPIVYEDPEAGHYGMAMRWIAHDKPENLELLAVAELNAARDYQDYLKALEYHVTPIQNAVFASKTGDIALHIIGNLPLKRAEQGRFVQDGSRSSNQWAGFVPEAHEPGIKNPASGFVFSANQHTTDTLFPYYYNGKFDDYRARLIHQKLSQMEKATPEMMMAMQTDNYSLLPAETLPFLLEQLKKNQLNTIQTGLVEILETWDYAFDPDKRAPVLFDAWWKAFMKTAWDEFYGALDNMPVLVPEYWRTADLLRHDPLNVFWDIRQTPEREDLSAIALISFQQMIEDLKPHLDEPAYNWGKHGGFEIPHLGRIPAFASRWLEPGGYPEAINAIKPANGPSWRMIVEMGPQIKAYGVFPGGQSGNPGSSFYDNTIDTWARGDYFELFFMQSAEDEGQERAFTETYQ